MKRFTLLLSLAVSLFLSPDGLAQGTSVGNITIPTSFLTNPNFRGNKGMVIPRGTLSQRPSPALNGTIRYNTTLNKFEFYEAGIWVFLAGGGGGGDGSTMPIAIFTTTGTASPGVMFCNAAAGAFTMTLPSAALNAGRVIELKKTDVTLNVVTVAAPLDLIDGVPSFLLSQPYDAVSVVSNGSSWYIK